MSKSEQEALLAFFATFRVKTTRQSNVFGSLADGRRLMEVSPQTGLGGDIQLTGSGHESNVRYLGQTIPAYEVSARAELMVIATRRTLNRLQLGQALALVLGHPRIGF